MRKKEIPGKRKILILTVGSLIFTLAVVGIFTTFQHHLSESFHTILTSELEESTNEQVVHGEAVVSDLQKLLEMLAATKSTAVDEWELVMHDNLVHVDYLNKKEVLDICTESTKPDNSEIYAERLRAGEMVITELGDSRFTDAPSTFALLYPVFQEENLTGILRARIDAALLTGRNVNSASLFQKTYTVLTTADGGIVYADTPYPDKPNLFAAALQNGIGSDEMQSVQQFFKENETKTITFQGKGNNYYMSWKTLSLHNWRIVKFARSPDVILQTKTIVKGMVGIGICLIALTAVTCVLSIQLLLRQKRQLETQQRRYEALAQFNDTLLFEYDVPTNRMFFTPNALERLDLEANGLKGVSGNYYMQHLLHPDDQETIRNTIHPSQLLLGETYSLEARLRYKDGTYNWFECQFKSIENQNQSASRILGKLVDISNQRGREHILRQAALKDALTGVYNRSVETLINEQLEKDPQGLFFMIDLDNFKDVNDRYGHAAGDTLLINVAQILREVFRSDDIIARVGGDEFVVFIANTNNPAVAESKAAMIQSRMERLCIPGSEQFVSASIGAATSPQNGSTYDELTRAADQAMYSIKRKSKKGFALHQEK